MKFGLPSLPSIYDGIRELAFALRRPWYPDLANHSCRGYIIPRRQRPELPLWL